MKLRYLIGIVCIAVLSLVTIKSCNSSNDRVSISSRPQVAIQDCLFCKIVAGIEPSKIIAQNDDVIVFESIRPRYPSHWLMIPKKHIQDLKSITKTDIQILGKLLKAAGDLGNQLQDPKAFNIQINEGATAGQTVFHLHLHFYSESKLATNSPQI
jgi:histidine triad (HIT) family protein